MVPVKRNSLSAIDGVPSNDPPLGCLLTVFAVLGVRASRARRRLLRGRRREAGHERGENGQQLLRGLLAHLLKPDGEHPAAAEGRPQVRETGQRQARSLSQNGRVTGHNKLSQRQES